jgi:ferredoxin-thioredoxin reductase catalytic subunit
MDAKLLEYLKKNNECSTCGICKYWQSPVPVYIFIGGKVLDEKYWIGYCTLHSNHIENYQKCSCFSWINPVQN